MAVALSVVADALPFIPLIEKKILLLHASFSLAVLVNDAGNTTLVEPLLARPLASVVQLEPPFCVSAKSTREQLMGG
ncbi:hypothetical protein D3C73_1161870 [compost metagenome]